MRIWPSVNPRNTRPLGMMVRVKVLRVSSLSLEEKL
jgi:hypothetical protein